MDNLYVAFDKATYETDLDYVLPSLASALQRDLIPVKDPDDLPALRPSILLYIVNATETRIMHYITFKRLNEFLAREGLYTYLVFIRHGVKPSIPLPFTTLLSTTTVNGAFELTMNREDGKVIGTYGPETMTNQNSLDAIKKTIDKKIYEITDNEPTMESTVEDDNLFALREFLFRDEGQASVDQIEDALQYVLKNPELVNLRDVWRSLEVAQRYGTMTNYNAVLARLENLILDKYRNGSPTDTWYMEEKSAQFMLYMGQFITDEYVKRRLIGDLDSLIGLFAAEIKRMAKDRKAGYERAPEDFKDLSALYFTLTGYHHEKGFNWALSGSEGSSGSGGTSGGIDPPLPPPPPSGFGGTSGGTPLPPPPPPIGGPPIYGSSGTSSGTSGGTYVLPPPPPPPSGGPPSYGFGGTSGGTVSHASLMHQLKALAFQPELLLTSHDAKNKLAKNIGKSLGSHWESFPPPMQHVINDLSTFLYTFENPLCHTLSKAYHDARA
jgi:hypothetical protein